MHDLLTFVLNTIGIPVAHTHFLHSEIKVKPGERHRPTGSVV